MGADTRSVSEEGLGAVRVESLLNPTPADTISPNRINKASFHTESSGPYTRRSDHRKDSVLTVAFTPASERYSSVSNEPPFQQPFQTSRTSDAFGLTAGGAPPGVNGENAASPTLVSLGFSGTPGPCHVDDRQASLHAGVPTAVPSANYACGDVGPTTGTGSARDAPNKASLDVPRPTDIPISTAGGQHRYDIRILETTSGAVQLPVDVQAASRVANEKRRRNAGASARFRQRRKEKEKEASTTISRLEQQVEQLNKDVVFYRSERDAMAAQIRALPGGSWYLPREEWPQRRRSSGLLSVYL